MTKDQILYNFLEYHLKNHTSYRKGYGFPNYRVVHNFAGRYMCEKNMEDGSILSISDYFWSTVDNFVPYVDQNDIKRNLAQVDNYFV